MLKRLVVEFKDELEALGVKVAELDERVAVLEDRLGGWKISGVLALDVKYRKENKPDNASPADESDTTFEYDDAKLIFERWWGEDEEYHFYGRLNNDNAANSKMDRFFVEMPFFFDSRLTVGRFNWAWEGDYRPKANIGNVSTGGFGEGQHLMTDITYDGFGFTKNFALGTFNMAVAHPNKILDNLEWSDWMILARGTFQFTEQIGLDLGGIVEIGDNAEEKNRNNVDALGNLPRMDAYAGRDNNYKNGDRAFDKMWEIFAGLRFNFNDNIAFRGIFYHQKMDTDILNGTNWNNNGYFGLVDGNGNIVDDANHWALMLDVKQAALKYTSLWLEYGQYDQGFINKGDKGIATSGVIFGRQALSDIKYWRIALGQEWNDKWATHIFYYGYKFDVAGGNDWKPSELGLGVQYKLNDYTTMGLNYVHVKDATGNNGDDDDLVRFRTSISF
jgi:hypothetical protein